MSSSAADGGRRSRRGYAYQDAVTLLDCLDLHQGLCDEVGFEDIDDIDVVSCDGRVYRQVKTSENGNRHTIATVCEVESDKKPETSILGRLFTGKELNEKTRFCLTVNETPGVGLVAFVTARGVSRPAVADKHKANIVKRLEGLKLPQGFTIEWCVDRFEVYVEPRTIESVEDACLRRLAEPVRDILGEKPLAEELDDVLLRLAQVIARDAMRPEARRWDRSFMRSVLEAAIRQATGRTADGSVEPLPTLISKLGAAQVPVEEAKAQNEALLVYRRRYRSALTSRRSVLNDLNDEVFVICCEMSAQRRAGALEAGAPAYAATVRAVIDRDLVLAGTVTRAERLSALSDVTARCRNRYVDDA